MALLEIKDLTFTYPEAVRAALRGIELSVNQGEFVLICGASGCGKSTLLRQCKPALSQHGAKSGSILFNGKPVDSLSLREQSEKIGFVMQDPEMQIVTDKVRHELAFGLESLGIDNGTMRVRIAEMASFFGIRDWFDSPVSTLSGGQKQLLCLAAVTVMQPQLLLLDEPTSQLDPIAAGEFFNTLKRINSELGTTIIITEHRLENLFPMVDRVVFMRGGEIVSDCAPADAAEELRNDGEFFSVLPSAVRIFAKTRNSGQSLRSAPLEVRSARDYLLNSFSLTPCGVDKEKNKKSSLPKDDNVVISVHEAWFRYEKDSKDILRGMNFDIRSGELTCLVGSNGAGKTTALMTAAGVFAPYRGKVKYRGKPISAFRKDKNSAGKIGVLVQNPLCCFVADSVLEELELAAKANKIPRSRLEEVIDLMQLRNVLDSNPYDISGGELQRAAIAKLLLPEPEIIFLDEATKGMDAFFKAEFGALLRRLTAHGTAVVLVSHDIEFCAEFADRCAMFFNGNVVAEGTPREVFLGNSFYTTSAGRIARGIIPNALTAEQVIEHVNRCGRSESND